MPFGPYVDFNDCVAKNGDKSNPKAFCAWLHHKIVGTWPGEMSADTYPEPFWTAYDEAMTKGKTEKDAFIAGDDAAKKAGWNQSRFGWLRELQAPEMKEITGVRIFGEGTWTDSAGFEKTWSHEELQSMVDAFEAGVPAIVPIKCGHTSDEFNERIAEALGVPVDVVTGEKGQGQISLGKATALQLKGSWIIASFDKIPEPIANLIEGGQYSTVSVEIEDKVGEYGPVITGVALLGAEEPAVAGATLERALVFGGKRQGARVYSFQVGDDIPVSELKAEFEDIQAKLSEIVKGKRGAPLFRALFGNLNDIFDRLTAGRHSASSGDSAEVPAEIRALVDQEYQGNIGPLIAWAGRVGFDACVAELTGKPGITDPVRVCGWLKGQAHSHSEEGGNYQMPEELKAIAEALGLGEDATIEDIIAAIQALAEKAAAPAEGEMKEGDNNDDAEKGEGAMAEELKKANDRIAALEAEKVQRDSMAAWQKKTSKLTSIPGTADEYAISLAEIETKAGKEAAESQFKALEKANELAENATKIVGTSRTTGPSDFDNEVSKYMKDHPDKTKVEAIEAVMKEHPELYFARRDGWEQ